MFETGYEEKLARQLYEQGRLAEAEAAFRLALAKRPESAEIMYALAMCIPQDERPDEALALFRKVVKLEPGLADAWNGIGCCEEDAMEAELAFRRAVAVEPDCGEFFANLAVCLHRQGRKEEAELAFRRAVALEPDNFLLASEWGEILVELGRVRDADSALKRIIATCGERGYLLNKRAWWYYEEMRYAEAEELFTKLRGGGPVEDQAWLHHVMGKVAGLRRQLAAAVNSFRTAIALAPGIAEFHDALADALVDADQSMQAVAARTRGDQLRR